MHARPWQTDKRTDEHHGNSPTIRSNERIARWKLEHQYNLHIPFNLQSVCGKLIR